MAAEGCCTRDQAPVAVSFGTTPTGRPSILREGSPLAGMDVVCDKERSMSRCHLGSRASAAAFTNCWRSALVIGRAALGGSARASRMVAMLSRIAAIPSRDAGAEGTRTFMALLERIVLSPA